MYWKYSIVIIFALYYGECNAVHCDAMAAVECSRRTPGNFAFNSRCQCETISCLKGELTRSAGRIICDAPQCRGSKQCPSVSMLREWHTCNCLKISYPCPPQQVLWGDAGGPYICIDMT